MKSSDPAVNRFPAPRRFKATIHKARFFEGLAASADVRPFSVSENGALGTKSNRQGCDRTWVLSAFELSHSLVNRTQWLTALMC